VCGDDFVCGTETVADPGACLGTRCGDAQCVNLDGGSFVLEGLKTPRCDANGVCSDSIRDCRDPDDGECIANSGLAALTCSNCSPSRTTCIVYSGGCRCE
jgi:hypothetical protein